MSVELKNYINGKWVKSKGAGTIPVINPATGKTISLVPEGVK